MKAKPFSTELIESINVCGKLTVDELLHLVLGISKIEDKTEETWIMLNAAAVMLEYRCPTPGRICFN